tara:strand:+ start:39 stop:599 length:561 start_codon:yes stop_codon:yes gene_type:complete
MREALFCNYFYSKFFPANGTELLNYFDNPIKSSNQQFKWDENCSVGKERLEKTDEVLNLLKPSIRDFFNIFEFKQAEKIEIEDIWRCLYDKGSYQEIHSHCGTDLSGVLFLTDWEEGVSKFFFADRHDSEITEFWKINYSYDSIDIEYERGEILFFPSYMLHGVTQHKHELTRKIVSFNLKFPQIS